MLRVGMLAVDDSDGGLGTQTTSELQSLELLLLPEEDPRPPMLLAPMLAATTNPRGETAMLDTACAWPWRVATQTAVVSNAVADTAP